MMVLCTQRTRYTINGYVPSQQTQETKHGINYLFFNMISITHTF